MLLCLPDVTLQITRHEVALHVLRVATSEHQVITRDPVIMSKDLMVQNGRKCIT